jgi:hypothetical protein
MLTPGPKAEQRRERFDTLLHLVRTMPSDEQRVVFAISCARAVYHDPAWAKWAERWVSGTDRSKAAALAARDATRETTARTDRGWAAADAAMAAAMAAAQYVERDTAWTPEDWVAVAARDATAADAALDLSQLLTA